MPTHADLTLFFQRYLPSSVGVAKEVPFLYHIPRHSTYSPTLTPTLSVVLSITPTPGFLTSLNDRVQRSPPVCFLHRPWNLDRRAVRPGVLILSSHASFDEHLTVGWNVHLAERLGLDLSGAICVQGYKDNPDRKIGLIAQFTHASSVLLEDLVWKLRREYHDCGELYDPYCTTVPTEEDGGVRLPPQIKAVAIMNAFHDDEIQRVLSAARQKKWLAEEDDGRSILYLTGAARDYGLEAAKQVNMPAFCVGHRACEEWGIRFLAAELRREWPKLNVVEVLEEEEVLPKGERRQMAQKEVQQEVS